MHSAFNEESNLDGVQMGYPDLRHPTIFEGTSTFDNVKNKHTLPEDNTCPLPGTKK
jgi:hypothetical protein